ncbi:unnamed protein product [Vitrella brassicaformis CCMP3155]|uniref:Uncharacterized protein n=1 Tax=Vitrella brassicaformis (strain CCMP3155) TaxID=1169540 RepID=A0A0G4FJE1_VITBC|nr:unnamed protein product [Vitrella brassicaformis CCMP3155]|eukprot:CEM13218.1 unnamed protein product [Vitrella brassicaformis CCMP3155]
MQQQHQQQHPFSYIFVGRRTFYLLSLTDILQLRATCKWLSKLFGAAQLRDRLRHSLGSQAGLRRVVNGRQVQLMRFDDEQFGVCDLLHHTVCVMEEGEWVEIGEVIEWAGQCGCCALPLSLTADDINTHASKTAYLSVPRVLAQLMVVGRHANGNGSCLRIFRYANGEVRAIKDEPGFELDLNPPLLAGHLYQQHRLEHGPPVASRIEYSGFTGKWTSVRYPDTYASVSSFAKRMICFHFYDTHRWPQPHLATLNRHTLMALNRRVGGGRLDGLLTDSPHTPVAGCTTTLTWNGPIRDLVLTDSSHTFVAWINLFAWGGGTVRVQVWTTEAPVAGEWRAFKDRFPVTTRLARVAFERAAPYVFDGQVPTMAAMMRAVQVAVSD